MEGKTILEGRYRIVQRLSQRPRLNLYLGKRLLPHLSALVAQEQAAREPLVAIRELVLAGLAPQIRMQVENAAFEEFLAPTVFGSPRLPTSGDRIWVEGERHYLVIQLSDNASEYDTPSSSHHKGISLSSSGLPTTLDALLLSSPMWPTWLNTRTALHWCMQLSRMVARLHHQGVILGNLTPATVLIDAHNEASWSPVLLPSWPPAPVYWKAAAPPLADYIYAQVFPIAVSSIDNVFAAPELLSGNYDERSDVYSLGAILYLLCTHYAPISAQRRRFASQEQIVYTGSRRGSSHAYQKPSTPFAREEGLELVAPRLLNGQLPQAIEDILLCALDLEPVRRYSSVFALVEALEAIV